MAVAPLAARSVTSRLKGSGGWTAGFNVSTSYTGSSHSAFGPQIPAVDGALSPNDLYLEVSPYWLTNVSARLQLQSWTLRLFVDNVFNEDVDLYRTMNSSNSQYRSPFVSRGVNQPRTIGLQLTWNL